MVSSILRAVRRSAIAALALTAASLPAQLTSLAPSRILAPVDDNARVALHGYLSPLATAANDRGPAPDSMPLSRIHLILRHSPAQQAALDQYLSDVHNPASPSFHKWLTPAQFGQQFGPSDQDIATVESWLSAHGFEVDAVKPGKQVLEFSGNVAQMRTAFQAQIHRFQVDGHTRYSTATEPTIPAALAPVIGGFVSLNDFHPQTHARVLGTATYNTKTNQAAPNWTYGTTAALSLVLSPQDFGVEYDLPNPLTNAGFTGTTLDGTGQSIAILDFSNIDLTLVTQFQKLFGLPQIPPNVIVDGNDPGIDGINNPEGPQLGTSVESYLDVEWADAVAPKANIDLIVAADTELEYGGFLAAERAVDSDIAPVISSSIDIGGCEQTTGSYNPFIDSLWQQAAAEGITVVVAAGDSGSAGCDSDAQEYAVDGLGVDNWASTPWDIAVGGTDFYYTDYATAGSNIKSSTVANYWNLTLSQNPAVSLQKYVPEQPWNDSQFGLDIVNYYTATQGSTTIAAGSGGASSSAICSSTYSASTGACLGTLSGYPKPAWQTGVTGIPNDNVRDIPDVSLFAADGLNASYYPICASDGDCQTPSGSNLWQITGVGGTSGAAPAFAGIMALVNEKYGAQGQAAAVLYPLKTKDPAAFHDITSGTNAVPCATGSPNCVSVTSPITIAGSSGTIVEGETGSSAAADYKAAAGYNLATGLGSVDAANLIANWSSAGLGGSGVTLTSPIANSTFAHGAAVTFTGTVTGSTTPTGSVAIMTSSPETSNQGITTLALNSSGGFSGTVTYLPGGTYTVWASYGGDAKNGASTSPPISITVSQESSTVTLAAQNLGTIVPYTTGVSVPYGTQLLFDAQVFGASCPSPCNAGETSATGSMVFADGANQVGTVVLSSEGSAEWNAPLTVGSHSIIARYPGDATYQSSSSSAFAVTVTKNTPVLVFSSSSPANGLLSGQPNVLTVMVLNSSNAGSNQSNPLYAIAGTPETIPVAPPTGTLTISGGPNGTPATATLTAAVDPTTGAPMGVGTITIPSTTSSSITLNITYNGDNNYNSVADTGSNAVGIGYTSAGGTASTTAATVIGTISPTTTVTISGTVTGASGKAAPTGTVVLYADGYTDVAQATLTASTASVENPFRRFQLLATGGGAVFACVLLLAIPARRRAWRNFLALVVIVCIAGFDIGCGGGSSGGSSGGGGGGGGGGGSAPYANFTMTVNSQALLQGANTITLQYTGDNTYAPSSSTVTNPVSNPLSDFALTAASATVTVPASGSSAPASIYITPTNGFSGAVSLSTCAVGTGAAGAPTGLTCTVNPNQVTLSSTATNPAQPSTLTVISTGAAKAGNYPVTITATSGSYAHTLGVTAVVQ